MNGNKSSSHQYVAFMLRLWRDQSQESEQWCASLENPRTGERKGFAEFEDAVTFIRQMLAQEQR